MTKLSHPTLLDADRNTVTTHRNYNPKNLYGYNICYRNPNKRPMYQPIEIPKKFPPKFQLQTGVLPTIENVVKLGIPDKIINTFVKQSNLYAVSSTKDPEYIINDDE